MYFGLNNMKNSLDLHKFKVIIVQGGRYLEKAQFLRRKVFFQDTKKDEDEFDRFCKHAVVIDRETNEVVGTYRLLLRSVAEKAIGFYSETEFDMSNIKKNCKGELLEMGRACVDEAYRKYPIINLIWKAILSYLRANEVKYIFGCASVDHPNPQKVGEIFKFFKSNCFSSPALRTQPLKHKSYPYLKDAPDIDEKEIMGLLPSLIKIYLKMGALVCGEPVWDKIFDTADFFMILDVQKMNLSYVNKLL